jgi:hypothetical protein
MRLFFTEVAAHVLGTACIVSDSEVLIGRLLTDEAALHRIMMILVAPNSYFRVAGRSYASLSDWSKTVRRSYPLRDERAKLPRVEIAKDTKSDEQRHAADPSKIQSHRGLSITSVIDLHAWDQAHWRGCGYFQFRHDYPPFLAFLYENAEPAQKIFERWRARFGKQDANEEIAISIIRNLPETNPHHYCVQISSKLPAANNRSHLPGFMATRSMMMEPANSTNLERFLSEFRRFGAFFLIPATGQEKDQIFVDHAILKRELGVKSADEVEENDIESLALRQRGLKFAC